MSDLWAQFSLGFVQASFLVPSTTPIDDEANSIQTVNGMPYLVSVATDLSSGYTYENLSLSSDLGGAIAVQYLYNPINGVYAYTTWAPEIDAVPASTSDDLSTLNDVPESGISQEFFPNEVLSTGPPVVGNPGNSPEEALGWQLTVEGVLNTAVLPAGEAPTTINAPLSLDPVSAFGNNFDIYYPQYIWVDLGPASPALSIAPSDKTEADTVGVIYNANFSDTSSPASGSIAFTDTDTNAGDFTATITDVDVTATDEGGNSIQLMAQQIGQLQAAMSVDEVNSSQSNDVTNGSVSWDFSSGGLTTVAPGETAVVTSTVQVSDSDGNSDTATVAVTVTGPTPPANVEAGLDINVFPGISVMDSLIQNTNLSWTGFYLNPAPSRNGTGGASWMGNLQALLNQGWHVAPIYVGYQADTNFGNNPALLSNHDQTTSAAELGTIGAAEAIGDMFDASGSGEAGFPLGTAVYLDIESFGPTIQADPNMQQYIASWCKAIQSGGFIPGIYGPQSLVSYLKGSGLPSDTSYWMTANNYQQILTSQAFVTDDDNYSVFPTYPTSYIPGNSSNTAVDDWQYATNLSNYSIPGVASLGSASFDLDMFTNTNAPIAQNDFSGDGEASILWTNSNGDTELWNPNGSGGFTYDNLGAVNSSWQIAGTGDFNGADEAGVLWRNTNGDTELWNPNGSGGFTYQDLGVVNSSWQIAGTGDFNGADEAGILWRNTNGDTELWNPNGSGGFTYDDLGVVNTSWQIAGTGDFNGDGDGILWRNSSTGDVEIWNSNGSGGFTYDDLGAVNASWQIAGTGDFTGTGEDSILWRNTNGDTELWNPNGSGGFTYQDLGVVNTTWQIVETGDFSGNGQSGILWRNNTNGDTELWNPNGSGGFTYDNLGVVPASWSVHKIFA